MLLLFMVMLPFLTAAAVCLVRKKRLARGLILVLSTLAELIMFLCLLPTAFRGESVGIRLKDIACLGIELKANGFSIIFGTICALMWFLCTVFSREYFKHHREKLARFDFFLMLTFGATEGVFLSADLFTLFVFFEIMSVASFVWVIHEETPAAVSAAGTYLTIAVIGGLVMLMGLFLLYARLGTLNIDELAEIASEGSPLYLEGVLIFFGFAAKAGVFPLHIWLPKAHPVAPAPASALLSGILTKTGIFGVIIVSTRMFANDVAWSNMILSLGVITMLLGAVLAVFSIDLKRTLACSSVSQIGFIMVGIGMNGLLFDKSDLAIRGAMLHMVNHSLFKLLLFLVAGAVYMNTHALDLNVIKGYGRKRPLLKIMFLAGALGLGGIPLLSGYVSKTLIHEGIVEYMELLKEAGSSILPYKLTEILFLFAGGLTVAYMLKLYVAIFVDKGSAEEHKEKTMSTVNTVLLFIPTVLIVLFGCFPRMFMEALTKASRGFLMLKGEQEGVSYFTLNNLLGALISIITGVLVYILIIRGLLIKKDENGEAVYLDRLPKQLDLENLVYRPIILKLLPRIFGVICRFFDRTLLNGLALLFFGLGKLIARMMNGVADGVIAFFKKTTHRKLPEDNRGVFEIIVTVFDSRHRERKVRRSLETTLSKCLMMFCIGLCLIFLYLLFGR